MFIFERLIEKEVKKRLDLIQDRRYIHERIDTLERRVFDMENDLRRDLHNLRMATDPEYKLKNTPVFGAVTNCEGPRTCQH